MLGNWERNARSGKPQVINRLNDFELSGFIEKIHHAHCLIDKSMADGEEKLLFLLLKNIHAAADDAMYRLNEIQTKKGIP